MCGETIQGALAGAVFLNACARAKVQLDLRPRNENPQVLLLGKQHDRAAAIPGTLSVVRDGLGVGMPQCRMIPGVARSVKPINVSRDPTIPRLNLQMANDSACHR